LKIADVLITGGEIYKAQDVLDHICKKLNDLNIPVSFSTMMFTKREFIETLLSYHPRSLNISFDPRGTESLRIYNQYVDAIVHLLRRAVETNTSIKITGVINKSNIGSCDKYLSSIRDMLDNYKSLTAVYITNPYDIGFIKTNIRASHKDLEILLTNTEVTEQYSAIKFVNFHSFNMPLQSCLAGSKYVHIEPNGNVYPCHLFANLNPTVFMMGNIFNDSANEINANLYAFGKQSSSAILEYKSNNTSCGKCSLEKDCGCGCLAEIISVGNLIEPNLICKIIGLPKSTKLYKPDKKQLKIRFRSPLEDLSSDEEEKIVSHIKSNIRKSAHDLAHGFDHTQCVVQLARFIAKEERANLRIVTAAAYFHDFAPRQKLIFESHTKLSAHKAVDFLKKIGFNGDDLDRVYHCIDTSSYGSSELGHVPENLEAKVVRDADWLDAIGARGIARVFAFGATHGCETLGKCSWDPNDPPRKRMSLVGPDPSPVYHFFSKLLWVKEKIATPTGRKIADQRHTRLIRFLEEYKSEMEEGDTDRIGAGSDNDFE
jgi:uncharacterized protein